MPAAERKPPSRQAMYAMLALQAAVNYVTRGSLAPMIQFIVADMQFSAAQKALLPSTRSSRPSRCWLGRWSSSSAGSGCSV